MTSSDSARDVTLRRWLTEVLGAAPERIEPASSDASFRRYLRVTTDGEQRILMDAPPDRKDCAPFLAIAARLRANGLHAPKIYAAAPALGLVLLEDLGDRDYLGALDEDRADELYAAAFDALVRLQSIAADALPAYDRQLLSAEIELFPRWFLERHLGLSVSPELAGVLARTAERLVAMCAEQPAVFVHRDYHSRNLMWGIDNPPGIIDFQDAVRGPLAYDVVSLLRDVYLDWPRQRIEGWVDDYHRRACAAGLLAGDDRARLGRWVDLTGVQRHLKVAGIFARLWYRDHKARYLADIPRTLDYLLEVAARHPETAALAATLEALEVRARARAALGVER